MKKVALCLGMASQHRPNTEFDVQQIPLGGKTKGIHTEPGSIHVPRRSIRFGLFPGVFLELPQAYHKHSIPNHQFHYGWNIRLAELKHSRANMDSMFGVFGICDFIRTSFFQHPQEQSRAQPPRPCLGQHGLPCARWTKHQDLGGPEQQQ